MYGIYIQSLQSNNTIINNILKDNYIGMRLKFSSDTIIKENNFIDNPTAIFSENVDHITFIYNTITDSSSAIAMKNAYTCNYSHNTIKVTTKAYGGNVFTLYTSNGNLFSNNYLENVKRMGYAFFLIEASQGNTITNNTIRHYQYGIRLFWSADYNTISNNIIDNNSKYGIYFESPSNENQIHKNIISNNSLYGIFFQWSAQNNHIYHNTFINNTYHANNKGENQWDDGRYGNYWDDYEEKYPDARKTLRGTWNIPYEINSSLDRFPLMDEYSNNHLNQRYFREVIYILYEEIFSIIDFFNNSYFQYIS
jgi:parallel beta-helix repeat protein